MEVKNIDPKLQTYLSARNLSIAEKMGFNIVMAPCNGCYHNLKKAEYDLANDASSREVNSRLSQRAGHTTYESGKVETIHALDWIKQAIGEEGLKARVKNSLKGLKVANYYGCMYTRPRQSFRRKTRGRARNPPPSPISWMIFLRRPAPKMSISAQDRLLRRRPHALGLRYLDQAGPQSVDDGGSLRRGRHRHRMPYCHTGLEMHQVRAEKVFGRKTSVKILYFTQLLGMALGLSARKVGVHENLSTLLPCCAPEDWADDRHAHQTL